MPGSRTGFSFCMFGIFRTDWLSYLEVRKVQQVRSVGGVRQAGRQTDGQVPAVWVWDESRPETYKRASVLSTGSSSIFFHSCSVYSNFMVMHILGKFIPWQCPYLFIIGRRRQITPETAPLSVSDGCQNQIGFNSEINFGMQGSNKWVKLC